MYLLCDYWERNLRVEKICIKNLMFRLILMEIEAEYVLSLR